MNLKNPIELYFDATNYNQNLAIYESRIEHFQNIIDKIKSAVPSILFDTDDLTLLFTNPNDFLASKIITEPTTVGGVELDRTKVFELLSCTDELKDIISEIETIKQNLNPLDGKRFLDRNTDYYFINSSNLVELKPQTLSDLVKTNTSYLTTEKQQSLYNCVQKISDAYNELKQLNTSVNPNSIQSEFLEITHGGTVKINHKAILRY